MKKLFLAIIITAGFSGVTYSQVAATSTPATPAVSASKAAIAFVEKDNKYEFGSIPQGTPVTHVFTFKNAGKEPLVLSSVQASCGCTTPEWPKEPVLPGASASIKVTYNAANPGDFTKTVTVVSNAASSPTILTIHGDVKTAAANTSAAPTTAPAKAQAAAPKKN